MGLSLKKINPSAHPSSTLKSVGGCGWITFLQETAQKALQVIESEADVCFLWNEWNLNKWKVQKYVDPLCHYSFTWLEIFNQSLISYAAQILYSGWSYIFNSASEWWKSALLADKSCQ